MIMLNKMEDPAMKLFQMIQTEHIIAQFSQVCVYNEVEGGKTNNFGEMESLLFLSVIMKLI